MFYVLTFMAGTVFGAALYIIGICYLFERLNIEVGPDRERLKRKVAMVRKGVGDEKSSGGV